MIKKIVNNIFVYRTIDYLLSILIIPSSFVMLIYRKIGSSKMINSTKVLKQIGIFPIRNHYYEPQFIYDNKNFILKKNRNLPGINLKIQQQLKFLKKLNFSEELISLEMNNFSPSYKFNINNNFFSRGDAEIYYQIIRFLKPKNIIEIGSGYSTLIALEAAKKNKEVNNLSTKIMCIEPFENSWLKRFNLHFLKKKIEDIDIKKITNKLSKGDILFIDSSHIIRPDGDVLKIFLEILPQLKKGVVVHFHDIFTPKNYLEKWLKKDILFWNEQYLLETLISNSNNYQILCSLNFLKHKFYKHLKKCCPYLNFSSEPGSIYIKKIR